MIKNVKTILNAMFFSDRTRNKEECFRNIERGEYKLHSLIMQKAESFKNILVLNFSWENECKQIGQEKEDQRTANGKLLTYFICKR